MVGWVGSKGRQRNDPGSAGNIQCAARTEMDASFAGGLRRGVHLRHANAIGRRSARVCGWRHEISDLRFQTSGMEVGPKDLGKTKMGRKPRMNTKGYECGRGRKLRNEAIERIGRTPLTPALSPHPMKGEGGEACGRRGGVRFLRNEAILNWSAPSGCSALRREPKDSGKTKMGDTPGRRLALRRRKPRMNTKGHEYGGVKIAKRSHWEGDRRSTLDWLKPLVSNKMLTTRGCPGAGGGGLNCFCETNPICAGQARSAGLNPVGGRCYGGAAARAD